MTPASKLSSTFPVREGVQIEWSGNWAADQGRGRERGIGENGNGVMPDGHVGEAARERPLGWERCPQSSRRAGWALYPQEDAGSFLGILTAEKVSRQTKGSVQLELWGEILGGPGGNRRKPEPRRREYVSTGLI